MAITRRTKSQLITKLAVLVFVILCGYFGINPYLLENPRPYTLPNTSQLVVHDGDTLRLGSQRVRLWGIDAPELEQTCHQGAVSQPCGKLARDALIKLIGQSQLSCTTIETDRYGRNVARCEATGIDLNRTMVVEGWALDYERYSGGAYQTEQARAEKAQLGIWAMEFETPWQWRSQINRR